MTCKNCTTLATEIQALRNQLQEQSQQLTSLQQNNTVLTESCLKSKSHIVELLNENNDLKNTLNHYKHLLGLPESGEQAETEDNVNHEDDSPDASSLLPSNETMHWATSGLGEIQALELDPCNPHKFCLGGAGGIVEIYDANHLESTSPVSQIKDENPITTLSFARDSKHLFIGGRKLSLYDTTNSKLISRYFAHQGKVTGMSCSSDDNSLLTGALDRKLILWSVEKSVPLTTINTSSSLNDVDLSRNDDTALCGQLNGTFGLWDLRSKSLISSPTKLHSSRIASVKFIDQSIVASLSRDSSLIVFDIRNQQVVKRFEHPLLKVTNDSSCFSLKNSFIAVGSTDGRVLVFDLNSDDLSPCGVFQSSHSDYNLSCQFISSSLVVSCSKHGHVSVFGRDL
ncbi:hypothetical protein P9112_005475 [Eukaryota sp. TZLM1-RC]